MGTLRDKRIFLMKGGDKGESVGIYSSVKKLRPKPVPKVLSNGQKLARRQVQLQVAKEEDKINMQGFAFEKIKVLGSSLKDKIWGGIKNV